MSSFRNIQRKGYAVPFAGRKTVFDYSDEEYSSDEETKEEETKEEETKEEDSTNVVEFKINDVPYWKDVEGNLYDPESQELIGFDKTKENPSWKFVADLKLLSSREKQRDFPRGGAMIIKTVFNLNRSIERLTKAVKRGTFKIIEFKQIFRQETKKVDYPENHPCHKKYKMLVPASEKFIHTSCKMVRGWPHYEQITKETIYTENQFYNKPFTVVEKKENNMGRSDSLRKEYPVPGYIIQKVSVLLDTSTGKLYELLHGKNIGVIEKKVYPLIYSKNIREHVHEESKTGRISLHEFVERHIEILAEYGIKLDNDLFKNYSSYSHRLTVGITVSKKACEYVIGEDADILCSSLRMVNYKKWCYDAEKLFKSVINCKRHPNYWPSEIVTDQHRVTIY